jgi:[protein-PII] uridylyltransferase
MTIDLAAFKGKITATSDQAVIAEQLRIARTTLLECDPSDPQWSSLPTIGSEMVDAVIGRLFQIECAKIGAASDKATELAIVATGGYGRRELAPYSDIDVTFVPTQEDDDDLNVIIKGMFQAVMDVFLYGAQMKVGYAYRLLGDFGQLDHQTQTSLLDCRLVAGSESIFERFEREFRKQVLVADFLFQKSAERNAVLSKLGSHDIPFTVEPNVKEGAGGLRDAQCIEWFGQVVCGVRRDGALGALVEKGLLSQDQREQFDRNLTFIQGVRTALHCSSREARDVLTTEKQEVVAKMLAYEDALDRPGVEQFMADYFVHTAEMRRIARQVMRRCCDSALRLGVGGLSSVGRRIVLSDIQAAELDGALPLHVCELSQAYQLDFGDTLEEDVHNYLGEHPQPERFDLCGRVLARILGAPRAVSASVRWLADQQIVDWIMPEFAGLRYLIPYDAAHDFTVGEHSLRVVEFLEALRTTEDPRFADYRRAWQEVDKPEVLYLAGLLHDVGKQWPEQSHGESGATVVEKITERLGWSEENSALVVFLVRNHLLMAETSRLRDMRLEETIRDFTRIVDDTRKLHMLFILTCADTYEVGAGVWTEMKSKFLAELFGRAETALAAASGTPEDGVVPFVPDLAKHRERIRKQLAQQNLPTDAIHEHTARMPAQYLLNTPLEEMYLHMAMINRLRSTGMAICDFRTEFGADFTELTIVAYDDARPGLLAKIFGVLYALDVNLHASQVFTRESSVRIAIDTLWMDFRGKPLSAAKKSEVQETIRAVLTGHENLRDLFERRKKPDKDQVIHAAKLDDVTSERYSLLEVRAPMEPGVIYRLARAISKLGWNIHSARLSLWGSRVRAAFYVTTPDGQKVASAELSRLYTLLPREDAPNKRAGAGAAY